MLDGLTVTLDTSTVTVNDAVADAEPDVAVIEAVPFATAVTNPDEETVAVAWLDDAHVTVALAMAAPPASFTVAVSCCVAPIDESVTVEGATVRDAATCCTVTAEDADADPDVAVIVAVPLATAVTNPDEETVAVAWLDDAHVTEAVGMAAPCWSNTAAVSCWVAPSEARVTEAAESDTVVGTGGCVGVSEPVQEARTTTRAQGARVWRVRTVSSWLRHWRAGRRRRGPPSGRRQGVTVGYRLCGDSDSIGASHAAEREWMDRLGRSALPPVGSQPSGISDVGRSS